jgi:hypothetical protein
MRTLRLLAVLPRYGSKRLRMDQRAHGDAEFSNFEMSEMLLTIEHRYR